MKRFLITLGITLGFFLLGAAVHAEMSGANKPSAAVGADTATAGCPDCSGTAHTIQNVTFYAGTECECIGTESLTIGPNVIVQEGAKVAFKTPNVKVLSRIRLAPGSVVKIVRVGEPAASLSVTANPANIPANGTTYSIITATLTDGFGQPAAKGSRRSSSW